MKPIIAVFTVMFAIIIGAIVFRSMNDDTNAGPKASFITSNSIELPLPKGGFNRLPQHASFELAVQLNADFGPGGLLQFSQGYVWGDDVILAEDDFRYGLPPPQWDQPPLANYLTVEGSGRVNLAWGPRGKEGRPIRLVFPDGAAKGTEWTLHFGDRSEGSPGHQIPRHPARFDWVLQTQVEGDSELEYADRHPIGIIGTNADSFAILTPAQISSGEVLIHAVAYQGVDDPKTPRVPAEHFEGSFTLRGADGSQVEPSEIVWTRNDRGVVRLPVSLKNPQCQRLQLLDSTDRVVGESPPFEVHAAADTDRLYWGSLQNHTAVGGHAIGLPQPSLDIARFVSRLDFVGLTEHAEARAFRWTRLCDIVDGAYDPNRFVTFAGFEWTHETHGHRHVILRSPTQTKPVGTHKLNNDPDVRVAEDLATFQKLLGQDPNALIIPHHTPRRLHDSMQAYDWGEENTSFHAVEVYSWHGATDRFDRRHPIDGRADKTLPAGLGSYVFEQLALGAMFAIVGDGDQHFGQPGVSIGVGKNRGSRVSRHGLTGVWSRELSRESLFEALQRRSCYATTGARIRLRFEIESATMGFDGPAPSAQPKITIDLMGTTDIDEVVLWRNGQSEIKSWTPQSRKVQLSHRDEAAPKSGTSIYHITVRQHDEHRAWSSPIRLHFGG